MEQNPSQRGGDNIEEEQIEKFLREAEEIRQGEINRENKHKLKLQNGTKSKPERG